jgi:hypothetical protein
LSNVGTDVDDGANGFAGVEFLDVVEDIRASDLGSEADIDASRRKGITNPMFKGSEHSGREARMRPAKGAG